MEHVIVIGSGLGGLFCGAILAKEGYKVKVFEQHCKTGGSLHQFCREGVWFETGMHVIGAFQEGGALNRICSWLGIMDRLRIKPAEDDCFEHFKIGSDGKTFRYAKGATRFVDTLAKDFPEERENIRRYVKAIYDMTREVKLYNLEYAELANRYSDAFHSSVGDFIASFTDNERLQAVLALSNTLYDGDRDVTPAFIHAFTMVCFIEGAAQFAGGSQQLANELAGVITGAGGSVVAANGVTKIEIVDKRVEYIETADGKRHTADRYISSIHPASLFALLDTAKLQRSYQQRISSIPNTCSAFTVYIIFHPKTFPALNYAGYYLDDYSLVWKHNEFSPDTFPTGIMYITPPKTMNDRHAEKMIVNCMMPFDAVRKWENTTVGNRGAEYEAFKRRCEEQIIQKLEKVFPDIRSKIKSIYSASPLTIRDYYKQKDGAMYGIKKDCRNMALSKIMVRTKLNNLLLTGQNINMHGILGVPLTAVMTCGEIVGYRDLLEKINRGSNAG
ncbi:MAG: NAD(P)/FAD-dependent oxidoreductase [Dysgonamonadaceae bacterium]|jgi:all-trans-retinol 13,14-reductase|nr:NAD(P)/FAD-dependent oxidoreductase [Dysgonamonadaceae bacterium]